MKKPLVTVAAVLAHGFLVLSGQEPTSPAVFTAAQAEAGRVVFQSECAKCHTYKLTGRKGESDELPLLSSLPEELQKTIRGSGRIPPLAGPDFLKKWSPRTTKDLSKRIWEAAGPDGETYLDVTAYVLQFNGARPGTEKLTADTAVLTSSVVKSH